MEEIRIICTPFLLAAIVSTLVMIYYELRWKNKNPWWQQNDREIHLSPAEQAYRQNERRKHHNVLMLWFAVTFLIIGLMLFTLSAGVNDDFRFFSSSWFYLVPIIGMIALALSNIKHK